MGSLNNYVTVTISRQSVGLTRAGFGTAALLSYYAGFAERVRYYSSFAALIVDFPVTTSPEYLWGQAVFGQNPCPTRVAMLRGALKPTLQYTISAAADQVNTTYKLDARGKSVTSTTCSYAAGSSVIDAQIHDAQVTALNAVVGKNFTAALAAMPSLVGEVVTFDNTTDKVNHVAHGYQTGDGAGQFTNSGGALPTGIAAVTDYYVIRIDADNFQIATSRANALAGTFVNFTTNGTGVNTFTPVAGAKSPALPFTVTGDAAGNWFSIEVPDTSQFNTAMTHADPGVATDLAACALEQPDWYALDTTGNSDACVLAAAGWVQANKRIYLPAVQNTADIQLASNGTNGTLDKLNAAARDRTHGIYMPRPSEFYSGALMGRVLPIDPGGETWADKHVSGPTVAPLTDTQRANLIARNANSYELVAGTGVSFDGRVSAGGAGDFLDNIRFLDFFVDDAQKRIFGVRLNSNKVGMTNPDITKIGTALKASGALGVRRGGFVDGSFVVDLPDQSEISAADRQSRTLNGVSFTAQLAQAAQRINVLGNVIA
jgi:hypothetical protein